MFCETADLRALSSLNLLNYGFTWLDFAPHGDNSHVVLFVEIWLLSVFKNVTVQ